MSKLKLSVAVGNYDRVRPLMDGAVQIDGVDPVFMNLPPEEIFFRAFRGMDFDICELSMSSFAVKTAERNCPYVGVPAFVSRAFRHNSIYVRKDRVKSPADLKGRRVGLPEYQLTACVWARIILEDDHGVKPSDIVWVRGGIEHPGRPEKIAIKLPAGVRMEDAPQDVTISELLERGDIDGAIMDIGNAFELEKRGEGRILVRFTDIKDFHIHVIFATDALIARRPQAVRAFLKGWFETIAFMRKNKPETVAIAGEVTHKDAKINARVYDELMPMFSDDGKFNASALATLAKSYVELQLLPQEPTMTALYTEAFLPK